MKISIRSQLVWLYSSTVFIILLVFSLVLVKNFHDSLIRTIDSSLFTAGITLNREVFKMDEAGELLVLHEEEEEDDEEEKTIGQEFIEEMDEFIIPNGLWAQLVQIDPDESSLLVEKSENFSGEFSYSDKIISAALKKKIIYTSYTLENDIPVRVINYLVITPEQERYLLQIGLPRVDVNKTMLRTKILLISLTPILLLLITLVGVGFVKRAFSPIKAIVNEVNAITAEDLSLRIESLNSKDEIGELVETFNQVISRLESSFTQIKQFSSDVSHELKTPLTILKGEIEVMLLSSRSSVEYEKILPSLLEEVDKLQKIISNLLFISHLESPQFDIVFSDINLNECVMEAFDGLYKLALTKEQKIDLDELDFCQLSGDKHLLIRLFSNLLENAIKYTPHKGLIKISLHKNPQNIIAEISDNGIGMEKQSLDRIFDRFYRIDESRNSKSGGTGLGLALVQKIAQIHQAKIEVESNPGQGSSFKIIFPIL